MNNDRNRFKVRLCDGLLYDPWNPSGSVPSSTTVAHGLANLCRYGGHVKRHYTVGEHSIWVALHLLCRGSDNDEFKNKACEISSDCASPYVFASADKALGRLALLGLIHDCPEGCGLVDVPGPVLRHKEMDAYKQAHERCMAWLYEGWGIDPPTDFEAAMVKAIDYSILGAEMVLRPDSNEHDGSGENLPPWPGLNLLTRHNLARGDERRVRDVWINAFRALKR